MHISCIWQEHVGICGAIAQLGERYNGIVEVVGSIPIGSTIQPRLSRDKGKAPFAEGTFTNPTRFFVICKSGLSRQIVCGGVKMPTHSTSCIK